MPMLMCPHCGWKYDPRTYTEPGDDGRPFALVPAHPRDGDMASNYECPGTEQHPRNPETDRRPLWKDLKTGC
jgi:hypothetical protein